MANFVLTLLLSKMAAGQPLWARLFYLVRTGHIQEALREALRFQQAIEHREASFVNHFRTWIESPERKRAFHMLLAAVQVTDQCCRSLQITETPSGPFASYL